MFKFLQKKEQKDPICGMIADKNFISKHGEKFCSEDCVKKYEEQNQIAGTDGKKKGGCCCR
ncbi:MAG: hypothetical protein A3J65_00485 [Candidatus Buchananbacteria bacterium RIFCSPHIGHO2_02_FULL_45_11b]|uniref:TRASH domain-containing protein n=4 Tax=Candidatus Buchananiibacteriota TaxID=1817903 RepID=A0A1G1Y4U7_9BACT|nr:MAG: hypothetical protein A2663_01120 [Candidatus Buchananbacteria bacterium RIFCSPHIGHO2_01_FULL_46_12]OGY49807.1 MAG: hypothetical protein A3J65_00485 [Candidatus Buchananbacteria bacterium RIFCSPHIGHO2_02_FULL_45_11b]OGY53606.1 MAG: hypothetical protein A3B15_03475 [Candidatus Buchananbacteria bacterium RIFCSPLOWO2_01_FULL_45_31]OGY57361.1 MAG: hypothetical protein A3H67_04455 [Candidatus Buchananbacteria bacterium RIFCSPLOWO2_02_FULL_46_11b]